MEIRPRACGERDDWLPKAEEPDISLGPPGVWIVADKARSSINLSRARRKISLDEIAGLPANAREKEKETTARDE